MHLLLASALLLASWQSHTANGAAQNLLYRDGAQLRYTQNVAGHTQSSILRLTAIGGVSVLDVSDGYNVVVRTTGIQAISMHFDRNQGTLADGVAAQIRALWLSA